MRCIEEMNLFCDKYRSIDLCEYEHELTLIRQIIELTEDAVTQKKTDDLWNHDGICHMFAKSVTDYLKMSYDNLLLGHFYASHMIFRAIIENIVCLDVIQRYQENELWKYYLVQSYRNALISSGGKLRKDELEFFEDLYKSYGIEEEFIAKSTKKEGQKPFAYIDRDYGWTYKINKNFTFFGLCALIDPREYKDFKWMSMYSHGTAIYLKVGGFASMDHIMSMLSFFYYGINRLFSLYCPEMIDYELGVLIDELEEIIEEYIGKHE